MGHMKNIKNPVHELGISVFSVSWRKDKATNERIIITGHRPGGETCYAWNGYGDEVLARAGGYGYDKTSAMLKAGIEKMTGLTLDCSGAAGLGAVIKAAAKHKVKVSVLA